MPRSDGFDDQTHQAKADYVKGKADQQEAWGSKENLFSSGQLTPSARYKENGEQTFTDPKWKDWWADGD